MKNSLLYAVLFCAGIILSAVPSQAQEQEKEDAERPFALTEVKPKFSEGDFLTWMQKNVSYPEGSRKARVQGRVSYTFVIERNGSISDIKILAAPDNHTSKEVEALLNKSPKWTPGVQKGESVRVRYTGYVDFRFASSNGSGSAIKKDSYPTFKGKDEREFDKWILTKIKYPKAAKKAGITGIVEASYTVMTDGSVGEINIISSPDQELSDEVIRVLSIAPKWSPGLKKGIYFKEEYSIKVNFKGNMPITANSAIMPE